MFARVASFEGGDMERLRQDAERRMGEGETPGGAQGWMVLADVDANKRLFITFFETREALEEGDRKLDEMGNEIPEEIRGRRTGVASYEVVNSQVPATV